MMLVAISLAITSSRLGNCVMNVSSPYPLSVSPNTRRIKASQSVTITFVLLILLRLLSMLCASSSMTLMGSLRFRQYSTLSVSL